MSGVAMTKGVRVLRGLQGAYYLATGVWPIVSIETFQMVTGRKTDNLVSGLEADHWPVALLVAAWQGRKPAEAAVLALASAAGLTAIDVIYVGRGVIPPIYLADAAAETVLIAAWIWFLTAARKTSE